MKQLTLRSLSVTVPTLALTAALLLLGAAPALAAGNDYPYAAQTSTTALDPRNFTERQCTSFVAWRSYQNGADLHDTAATPWGNASHWPQEATALGDIVDSTPTVGAFAQWNAGEKKSWTTGTDTYWFTAGSDGHIAYVADVYTDGTVLLEDYNGFGGSRVYSTKHLPATGVPRYIHHTV